MQLTTNLKLKKPEIADAVNIDDLNSNADTIDTEVAKIASTSQAGRMSITDKTKLDGIQAGAQVNAVTSVSGRTGAVTLAKTDVGLSSVDNAKQATKTEFDSHVADEVKHITATERTTWNAKASTVAATTSSSGLMVAADKSKLDGIAAGANNYVHPANHPASVITQDASNRFVTDAEKTAWNAKANLSDIDSRTRYGVTTGTATALVLTLTPAPSALYAGMEVKVKLHVTTGANVTLNVSALGAKLLKKADGSAFVGKSGQIYSFIHDGTSFISSSGGGGGELNVFRQSAQPTTFNGVWIKDSTTTVNAVVTDTDVTSSGAFSSDISSVVAPNSGALRGSTMLNSLGHVFGGYISPNTLKDTHRYNDNNTWTKLADMGFWRSGCGANTVNGMAYISGGTGNSSTNYMERYNPTDNTWSTLALCPTLSSYETVIVGTDIYVMTTNQPFKYNTLTNTYTLLANISSGYGIFRGLGYFGGIITVFYESGIARYNIATNSWAYESKSNHLVCIREVSFVQVDKYVFITNVGNVAAALKFVRFDLSDSARVDFNYPTTTLFASSIMETKDSLLLLGSFDYPNNMYTTKTQKFVLASKTYPANTVIIVRSHDTIGIYATQFIDPDKALSGTFPLLRTGFDDVHFYDTAIQKNKETYYGNGSSWVRIK